MAKEKKETPLMKQYNGIKTKYPDALLLFRVGDFYETFGSDAIRASQILGITLTKRGIGEEHTELAGFPHHSLDTYLPKLVRAGLRVAICDQLEDPKW
jgi:DNA mismatch repair protein MutS